MKHETWNMILHSTYFVIYCASSSSRLLETSRVCFSFLLHCISHSIRIPIPEWSMSTSNSHYATDFECVVSKTEESWPATSEKCLRMYWWAWIAFCEYFISRRHNYLNRWEYACNEIAYLLLLRLSLEASSTTSVDIPNSPHLFSWLLTFSKFRCHAESSSICSCCSVRLTSAIENHDFTYCHDLT
jgi:hypothetical protein